MLPGLYSSASGGRTGAPQPGQLGLYSSSILLQNGHCHCTLGEVTGNKGDTDVLGILSSWDLTLLSSMFIILENSLLLCIVILLVNVAPSLTGCTGFPGRKWYMDVKETMPLTIRATDSIVLCKSHDYLLVFHWGFDVEFDYRLPCAAEGSHLAVHP